MWTVLENYLTSLPTPRLKISILSQSVNCILLIIPKVISGVSHTALNNTNPSLTPQRKKNQKTIDSHCEKMLSFLFFFSTLDYTNDKVSVWIQFGFSTCLTFAILPPSYKESVGLGLDFGC